MPVPKWISCLACSMALAAPSACERARAVPPLPDPAQRERIRALVRQLGDRDYKTREAAHAVLQDLPSAALPVLQDRMRSRDPEIKVRLRLIISHVQAAYRRKEEPLRARLRQAGVQVADLALDERGRCLLNLSGTGIIDLSVLKGLPLVSLDIRRTGVVDLSPLAGMELEYLQAPFTITRGFDVAANMKTLKSICGMPVARFRRECAVRKRIRDAGLNCSYIQIDEKGRCILSFSPGTEVDFRAFQGLPIKHLDFRGWRGLEDLSGLKGMALSGLDLGGTGVKDLTPLAGMPLTKLGLSGTKVVDLRPLAGMRLTYLRLYGTAVSDIGPLRGMPLRTLNLTNTRVRDLRPLAGGPLVSLHIAGTPITDLSPLRGMKKLWEVFFTPERITCGIDGIRNMPSIRCLGGGRCSTHFILADEFWTRYDAAGLGGGKKTTAPSRRPSLPGERRTPSPPGPRPPASPRKGR